MMAGYLINLTLTYKIFSVHFYSFRPIFNLQKLLIHMGIQSLESDFQYIFTIVSQTMKIP